MKERFKKNLKAFLIFMLVTVLGCTIAVGGAYIYLERSLSISKTSKNESYIPYSAPLPDSAGLLFVLPDLSGYLFFLDFENEKMNIAFSENTENISDEYLGYEINFKINIDYSLFANLIDRSGGLEIYENGSQIRYTGIQVTEKIYSLTDATSLKRLFLSEYIKKIGEIGFSKEDIVYIIKNSDTNLTVPECYNWPNHIWKLATNAVFIN